MGNSEVRPATLTDLSALTALLGELFAIEADFTIDPAHQERGVGRALLGAVEV